MGKVGALIGAASFQTIAKSVSLADLYLICAAFSLVGIAATLAFIPTRESVLAASPANGGPRGNFGHSGQQVQRGEREEPLLPAPAPMSGLA